MNITRQIWTEGKTSWRHIFRARTFPRRKTSTLVLLWIVGRWRDRVWEAHARCQPPEAYPVTSCIAVYTNIIQDQYVFRASCGSNELFLSSTLLNAIMKDRELICQICELLLVRSGPCFAKCIDLCLAIQKKHLILWVCQKIRQCSPGWQWR